MFFCFPKKGELKMDSVIQFRGTIYENGYGLIASKVMRDKSIPRQSRLIYAYMCSFAGMDKEGKRVAFPSVSLQCEELGMTEDTYFKWRKVLLERGLITIEKRKEKGKFERNLYFIEAVPVPKETSSEPYPKNSGTENSGTEKQGTNSNSSTNISFNTNSNNINNNIDDDKRTSPSGEDSAVHNDESINLLINNLQEATKDQLSGKSFRNVVRKVIDKYNQGKVDKENFRAYLVSALSNKIEELELRRAKDKAREELKASKQERFQQIMQQLTALPVSETIPFYNWLEE
jgi:hypothetical protein